MSKKIKAELLAIQKASRDKMLHAENVVTWARRHPRSALHRQFEWNNSRAANEFRLWQARRIIQINVIAEDGAPQLVSLSFDRAKGGGYRDVRDVASSRELSEIMLQDALDELQRVQARYQRVRALTSVWTAVKRVRGRQATRSLPRGRSLAKAA
jgi:hypothetical protein